MIHLTKIVTNYLATSCEERREKKLTASRSCSSKELAVVGPKPCSLSKAASSASLLFPYSVLTDIVGVLVASDIMFVGFTCCSNFCSASSLDCPGIFEIKIIINYYMYKINAQYTFLRIS